MKTKAYFIAFIHYFLKFILGLLVVFLLATIISLIISWKNWQQFAQEALAGQEKLKSGISLMQAKNFKQANEDLKLAEINFNNANKELRSLRDNWLPAKFNFGQNQLNHLNSLSLSALIISRSAIQVNNLAINLSANAFAENSNFSSLSLEQKSSFLQSLIALEPEINGLKANINLVLIKLNSIPNFSLLWPIRHELADARSQLEEAYLLLDKSLPIVRLLPAFSGYPNPAHYLILLQNNDELRPSGGFLGSYVRLDISNFGEINKLDASDIYHLDMPAIGKTEFQAPLPITNYLKVENWYMRDSNWSPDWPSSARQIQEMFYAENLAVGLNEPPMDAVIGITPEFVANLLRITGPISVKGETYAPENMQALLQYNVEIAYKEDDISSWDRKEIINDLISELKNRLINLSLSEYPRLLEKINESIAKKDLQIYFNNPQEQSIVQDLKASGELKQEHDDYLMVVDANLAAFKSDAVMAKNIFYKLKQTDKGLEASTKLNYAHNGGFDWRTTRYRSYTRVYAPIGSKLININGLKADETDVSSYEDKELNKQVFAFFWSIEPGQSREVSINYYLPNNIAEEITKDKIYNLLVQRQAGSRIEKLSIGVELNKDIESISPMSTESEMRNHGSYWTSTLDKDKEFKIIFK